MVSVPEHLKGLGLRFVILGQWNMFKHKNSKEIKQFQPKDKAELDILKKEGWIALGKAPFEQNWQEKANYSDNSIEIKRHNGNLGVICGEISQKLAIIDCDEPLLAQICKEKLPKTLEQTSGSGGKHYFYFIPDLQHKFVVNSQKKHYGEVQFTGTQVVIAPSVHPLGVTYAFEQPINAIATITKAQLLEALAELMQQPTATVVEVKTDAPIDRSRFEFLEIKKRLRQGLTKEQIFAEMLVYSKWQNAPATYREHQFNAAQQQFNEELHAKHVESKRQNAVYNPPLIRQAIEFLKLKPNNDYLIKGFIQSGQLTMVHSPPAHFKSLVMLHAALSIVTGNKFLELQTKKQAVLILDGENSDTIIQKRLKSLMGGHKIKSIKKTPLYFLKDGLLIDDKQTLNVEFRDYLLDFCRDNKVKLVVFDTMHRFALYDENRADDINRLYLQVFKKLQEQGISVLFLHHSTKQGGYRGSGDFLGCVEVCYKIRKTPNKINEFCLVCEKSRSGEVEELAGEIDFDNENGTIRFIAKPIAEVKTEHSEKYKETTNRIEQIIQYNPSKRADIIRQLDEEKLQYGSIKTIERHLRWLMEEKKTIRQNEKKQYVYCGGAI